MGQRTGNQGGPVGDMGGRGSHAAHHQPSFGPQYPGYDRADHGSRQEPRSRPYEAPMDERMGYERFHGQPSRYPEDEPYLEPPYRGRAPTDNRNFPQRRATVGQGGWTESDMRAMRSRMAGY